MTERDSTKEAVNEMEPVADREEHTPRDGYIWINANRSEKRLGRLFDCLNGEVALEGINGGFVYGDPALGVEIVRAMNEHAQLKADVEVMHAVLGELMEAFEAAPDLEDKLEAGEEGFGPVETVRVVLSEINTRYPDLKARENEDGQAKSPKSVDADQA